MDWPDDLLAGLPSPRGDEPASLRRDIEDELADHLHCAMQRERTATDDDQAARRAVLARFGNPRRVACKLWFDAMKGKIMKDRLMIAASILMMLTCAAAIGAMWLTLKESREVNAALLAQIKELAIRPAQPALAPNQASLKIKLITPDQKPFSDIHCVLQGTPFKDGAKESIDLTTDQNGIAAIGPILAGKYEIYILGNASGRGEVTLFSGQTLEKTFVCPANLKQPTVECSLKVDWPQELTNAMDLNRHPANPPGLIACTLVRDPGSFELDGTNWTINPVSLITSLQGDFTLDYTRVDMRDNKEALAIRKGSELMKRQKLLPGNYRLTKIQIAKPGTEGSRYYFIALEEESSAKEAPVIAIGTGGNSVITLPIPDIVKRDLMGIYATDRTVDLRVPETFRFRDLEISPQESSSGFVFLRTDFRDSAASWRNITLQPNKATPQGDYELTLESVAMVRDQYIARIHLRYVPQSNDELTSARAVNKTPATTTTTTQATSTSQTFNGPRLPSRMRMGKKRATRPQSGVQQP